MSYISVTSTVNNQQLWLPHLRYYRMAY